MNKKGDYEFELKVKDKKDKKVYDNLNRLDETNLIDVLEKYISFGVDLDGKRKRDDRTVK